MAKRKEVIEAWKHAAQLTANSINTDVAAIRQAVKNGIPDATVEQLTDAWHAWTKHVVANLHTQVRRLEKEGIFKRKPARKSSAKKAKRPAAKPKTAKKKATKRKATA